MGPGLIMRIPEARTEIFVKKIYSLFKPCIRAYFLKLLLTLIGAN